MEEEDELLEPVSPTAQCFNTSALSISVIAVVEFEIPIDEAKIMCYAKDFIPLNPLFSSIMVLSQTPHCLLLFYGSLVSIIPSYIDFFSLY